MQMVYSPRRASLSPSFRSLSCLICRSWSNTCRFSASWHSFLRSAIFMPWTLDAEFFWIMTLVTPASGVGWDATSHYSAAGPRRLEWRLDVQGLGSINTQTASIQRPWRVGITRSTSAQGFRLSFLRTAARKVLQTNLTALLKTLMGEVRIFRWNPTRSALPMTWRQMLRYNAIDSWEPMLTKGWHRASCLLTYQVWSGLHRLISFSWDSPNSDMIKTKDRTACPPAHCCRSCHCVLWVLVEPRAALLFKVAIMHLLDRSTRVTCEGCAYKPQGPLLSTAASLHHDQTILIHWGFEPRLALLKAPNEMIPHTTARAGSTKIHKRASRPLITIICRTRLSFIRLSWTKPCVHPKRHWGLVNIAENRLPAVTTTVAVIIPLILWVFRSLISFGSFVEFHSLQVSC